MQAKWPRNMARREFLARGATGLFAAAAFPLLLTLASSRVSSASPAFQLAANDSPVQSSSSDPRALYQALNALRPDGEHVYTIHELNLRRDVVNVRFIEGKLAFFQPIDGRVTGAVFSGHGHIFATPRDRGERHSIAQFLGVLHQMCRQEDRLPGGLLRADDLAQDIRIDRIEAGERLIENEQIRLV